MDSNSHRHVKTVPIRKRHGEGSSLNSNSSDVEGTFIPITACDSTWEGLDFINTKFTEDEEEDVIKVVDLQTEEKPPLFLLFPDLGNKDKERLAATTSTIQVAQILMGKKADFSLLKPSKKLNSEQSRLPPLIETAAENYNEDQEVSS